MREKLDAWSQQHGHRFKVVYAVGSRWANVHVGLKKAVKSEGYGTTIAELQRPPMAKGFDHLKVSPSQVGKGKRLVARFLATCLLFLLFYFWVVDVAHE